MLKSKLVSIIILFVSQPVVTTATPIYYDFRDSAIEAIDNSDVMNLTRQGITLTLQTATGVFNRTSSAFGINAPDSGDDTDTLDAGSGIVEIMALFFDRNVALLGFNVSGLGSNDIGGYRIGGEIFEFTSSGFVSPSSGKLKAGDRLDLFHVAGNGFSLDGVAVEPYSAPEPPTLLLLSLVTPLLVLQRKWRNRLGVVRPGSCGRAAGHV